MLYKSTASSVPYFLEAMSAANDPMQVWTNLYAAGCCLGGSDLSFILSTGQQRVVGSILLFMRCPVRTLLL